MAVKTFTAGAPLLASDINTNLMNQSVIVTTAAHTSLPTPVEGMTIYETDTDKLLIYTTATTTWVPPWNMPWGYVDSKEASGSNQSVTAGTFVDVTGVTGITATNWPANRRLRLQFDCALLGISGACNPRISVSQTSGPTLSATQLGGVHYCDTVVANYVNHPLMWHFNTAATGAPSTYVVKVIISNSGGAGDFHVANSQSFPAYAVLEDIGPVGAPA